MAGGVEVGDDVRMEHTVGNSAPAIVVYSGGRLEGVFTLETIDDKITHLYAMRDPDKLAGLAVPRAISR